MTTTDAARISLTVALAAALAACGGGGSSPETAPLTLSVTDTPIDPTRVDRVCIQFTGITVHYASQSDRSLEYRPLPSQVSAATHCLTTAVWNGTDPVPPVRLDALGGALTVALAESLQVPVGRITWVRLHFAPGGSYILDTMGGQHDLRCPSCEVTDSNAGRGFKLNRTFEVGSGGIALTVDVDLLKSLHEDASGFVLRPTARIEADSTLGTIAGQVDEMLISDLGGTPYSGVTIETGCAVYVYAGHDATPDDHYENSPVVSAARVRYDTTSGLYLYAAGALVDGSNAGPEPYTVALTCSPDDPLADEDIAFTAGQNADVTAGSTTTVPFAP